MTMWRFGFVMWAGWQMVRWGAVCALVLWLLYLWQGLNGVFLVGLLAAVVGLAGLRVTLRNLYRRESADRR